MNIIEGIKTNKKAIIKWGLVLAGVVVGGKLLRDKAKQTQQPEEIVEGEFVETDEEVEYGPEDE